ncbi:hypothetical protein [Sediminicurvatus halobius]|uniref:Uncharacterized protein n=1 Tax=Sediminicurvatus halobius TaxID=2182432 RepID=A0A2U2N3Q7_9GAMM|nr:hypothetical protein [Spiribacter halobius]PWG63723.1 hypothetical protein DEM34_07545 [Spiribacter halobius]UEX76203.1 hypothetical protein LMH63_09505 [Spiribacter halobius]
MSKEAAWLVVAGIAVVMAGFLLWKLGRLAAAAARALRGRSLSREHRRLAVSLLLAGPVTALGGGFALASGVPGGWQAIALGLCWLLGGLCLPATQARSGLATGANRGGVAWLCVLATMAMLAGIVLAWLGPQTPLFGTASLADLVGYGGLALYLGALWSLMAGPGGIAIGDGGGGGC